MHPITPQAPSTSPSKAKHALLSLFNVPSLEATLHLPYPTNEQTPTRFLASCAKMELDVEPNPFEQSFGAGTSSNSSSAEGPIGSIPTTLSALINLGNVTKTPGSLDGSKPTLPPLSAMASSTSACNPSELFWGPNSLRLGPLSPAMLVEPQQPPLQSPFPAANGYMNSSAKPGPLPYSKPTASIDLELEGTVTASRFDNRLVPPIQVQDFHRHNPQTTSQTNGHFSSYHGSESQSMQFRPAATGEEGMSFYPRNAEPSVPATVSEDVLGMGRRPPPRSYTSTTRAATRSSENISMHPQPSSSATSYVTTNPMVPVATLSNTRSSARKRKTPSWKTASRSRSPESPRRRSSTSAVPRSNGSTTTKSRRKGSSASLKNAKRSTAFPLPAGDVEELYIHETAPERRFNNDRRRKDVAADNMGTNPYVSRSISAGAEDAHNSGNHSSSSEEGLRPEDDKRKSFLERNRQAALKCRQRKKEWLCSLQQTVDNLSTDNESLQSQATTLREEIINLKTLLLAHKECPVAQANGVMGLDAAGSTAAEGVHVGNTNISSPTLYTALKSLQQRTMPATQYERTYPKKQPPYENNPKQQDPEYNIQSEAAPSSQESYSTTSNYTYPRRPSFTFTSHPPAKPQTCTMVSTVTGRTPHPTSSSSTLLTTINGISVAPAKGRAVASTLISATGMKTPSRACLGGQRRNSDIVGVTSYGQ